MSNYLFTSNYLYLSTLYENPLSLVNSSAIPRSRLNMKQMGTYNRSNYSSIVCNSNSFGSLKRIVTFLNNNNNSYNINGIILNLTDILTLLSSILSVNSYGANSSVQYLVPYYPGISRFVNNIPVINMKTNNYILFEFMLDPIWLENHNLFVFTPYFYSYNNGTSNYTIFGSTDQSIFFTKSSLSKTNTIKICCTSSIDIGSTYSNLGYFISKIPIEYISNSTYTILIRIGTLGPYDSTSYINTYMKTSIHTILNMAPQKYYTSSEIMFSYPIVYPPISNSSTTSVITDFNDIANIVYGSITNPTTYPEYEYLSNFVVPPVNYALQSFYDSINLQNLSPSRTPIDIQANNTCENYFITDSIPVTNDSTSYLFIVYLNQYSSGTAITSNIQIYNNTTHNEITGGIIYTGPNLPAMINNSYPFPASNIPYLYGVYIYPMNEIYNQTNGESILITERMSYGQTNYNHVVYNDITTSQIYVGTSSSSDISSLQTTLQNQYPECEFTVYSSS
jgi:hypothetical protein